ncbi:MAG TPA: hypothetical protein PLI51_02930 [bacterium]|nr:hypothetical protein [bacterium]HPQ65672.1 hypothetical protein [bacterium]
MTERCKDRLLAAALGLLGAALTFPFLCNASLLARSDAQIHRGIVEAVRRGGIPPENPFLAGEKLAYYWGYDALVAAASVTGADPEALMAAGQALAAAVLGAALYAGARAAGGGRSGGTAAAVLGIVGLNGFGWIAAARRGSEALAAAVAGGIWGYLPAVSAGPAETTAGMMMSKFLVANSLPAGLAGYAVGLALFRATIRKPSAARFGGCAALLALIGFLNLFPAAVLFLTAFLYAGTAGAGTLLFSRKRASGWAVPAAAATAAAVVLWPYLNSIFAPGSVSGFAFAPPGAPQWRMLLALPLPLWAALALALAGGWRHRSPDAGFFTAGLAVLAAAVLFLRLRGYNEYKLPFLLSVHLALMAGSGIRGGFAARGVFLIVVVCLPTTALGLTAYCLEKDRNPLRPEAAAVCRKAAEGLPGDAVVAADWGWYVPSRAERDTYLARIDFLRAIGTDPREIRRRERTLGRARSGDRGEVLKEISRELKRPVFWLGPAPDRSGTTRVVFRDGAWALYAPVTGYSPKPGAAPSPPPAGGDRPRAGTAPGDRLPRNL